MELFNNKSDEDSFSQTSTPSPQPSPSPSFDTPKTDPYKDGYKKGKRRGCLISFIIALCAVVVVFALIVSLIMAAVSNVGNSISGIYTTSSEGVVSEDYVEVIHIDGTISDDDSNYCFGGYTYDQTLDEIDNLIYDSFNKGIILYIDSPGGGVYESEEMYQKLEKYKELTGRKVYSYMANTAASGALYIAMASDEIYANKMTLTGSIGVITSAYDLSGLMEKLGIEEINIKSGENKDMGGYAGYNDYQRQIMQSIIDEYFGYFVNVISSSRGISEEEVRSMADGRVYSATQAQNLGLIDGVCGYDDFLDSMEDVFAGCYIYDRVTENTSLFNILMSETESEGSSVYSLYDSLEEKNSAPFSYMYSAQ